MAYNAGPGFPTAIRSSTRIAYTVDATYAGAPVAGAMGMQPTGGTVTDSTKPGVRRTLNLDLAPEPGLYDLLAPTGTRLTVTANVAFTGQTSVNIPMGVFVIDSASVSTGGGKISVTAPDRWVQIQRAKFLAPTSSDTRLTVVNQIIALIQGAVGAETVTVTGSSPSTLVPPLVWQQDRAQAIIDLATSIGKWVYADRVGNFVIADVPTLGQSADWLVDASPSGVLITLDRQKSRASTCNVVVVASSSSSSEAFPVQYAFDSDPSSPTFAGTDPVNHPETAGPFGIVPYFHSDPVITDSGTAQVVGYSILSRTVGVASSINATQVPNPALDAFDVLDVLPPRERRDLGQPAERHIADTVTHGLDVTAAQQIQGRSTRADSYT